MPATFSWMLSPGIERETCWTLADSHLKKSLNLRPFKRSGWFAGENMASTFMSAARPMPIGKTCSFFCRTRCE
jgi:hypothetical protein